MAEEQLLPAASSRLSSAQRKSTLARRSAQPRGDRLIPQQLGVEIESFRHSLNRLVVGQQAAVDAVTQAFQIFRSGLASSERPLGSFLFLGPTGTGKTNIVEAVAEVCFGDRKAMLKVDCAEFSHSHEIARLIGSPPGYLGHQETSPYLCSANLSRHQTPESPFTLILFDEIEKANDALWQLLLGILDKARLTLGNNKEVDLSSCFIFLTSNVGSRSVSDILAPRLGFTPSRQAPESDLHKRIEKAVLWTARRTFAPEFLNRIDHKIVFHRLSESELESILTLELGKIERRIARRREAIAFRWTERLRRRLLAEGVDPENGARPLNRVLERRVVFPLARLVASGQLSGGETLSVDWPEGTEDVEFIRMSPRRLVAAAS